MHDLSDVKALTSVSAEDQYGIVDQYDKLDNHELRMERFMQVNRANVVAELTNFKFKRVLKHNLVLMYAHVAARASEQATPWAADQEGTWVPRYLFNERCYGHRVLQRLINIDWKRT